MNPTEQTCDTERIDSYLDERLNNAARGEFEDHLSSCEYCQIELQRRAAEPDIWRDALELLSETHRDSSADSIDSADSGTDQHPTLGILESLTATDDPEMLGRLGDYEISGVVGVGGMGAVLKGFDRSLRRVVAIKVMAPHLAGSGSARTRFQREARAAAAITHNNVIDTYGVAEHNGLPYLVMPFARGPSLQKRIDTSGPLTSVEVVRIGHQIASGLAAAHEQGLVHRDIKPANILLNEGIERLWITDFGVARAVDEASMTRTGLIAGTPQFMSPEQARGESVDHRSDLFSMGSVLYTACTGRPPFRSEAAWGILRRITDSDPRPVREINPEIPDWLCQVIERLLAKHPSQRYQTAAEVADLLERCLAHLQQPTQAGLPSSLRSIPQTEETAASHSQRQPAAERPSAKPRRSLAQRATVPLLLTSALLGGLVLLGVQLTAAVDISGNWYGEEWNEVTLSPVEEAGGWYNGTFSDSDGHRGTLQLEWSRLQRRYNGRWKTGDDQSGSLTLRVRGREVRGAAAIDGESLVAAAEPRLREFTWTRDAVPPAAGLPMPLPADRPSMISIEAPFNGRIISWGEGIHEQARVSRGDVLVTIAHVDSEFRERLLEQLDAAERRVRSAENVLTSCEAAVEAARSTIVALEARVENYGKLRDLTAEANLAATALASSKVEAARGTLAEHKAALVQAEADFVRQRTLFEEEVISDVKWQDVRGLRAVAKAQVQTAEALVQVAENDLIEMQRTQEIQEAKARVELEAATAEVSRARGMLAAEERDQAKAQEELEQARKAVDELQVKAARSETMTLSSPVTGVLRTIHANAGAIVKAGDLICQLAPQEEPAADSAASEDAAPASARQPPAALDPPLSHVSELLPGPTVSTLPVTQTIEAAVRLGRRFREVHQRMGITSDDADSEKLRAGMSDAHRSILEAAERERQTGTEILQVRLEAARQLNSTHTELRDRVQREVATGELNPPAMLPARLAVLTTQAEIRQLEALLDYYNSLEQASLDEEFTAGEIAVRVLRIQLELGQQRLDLLRQQTEFASQLFQLGESAIDDQLHAAQAESQAAAKLKELEALLNYYERSGSDRANQTPAPSTESGATDPSDDGIVPEAEQPEG